MRQGRCVIQMTGSLFLMASVGISGFALAEPLVIAGSPSLKAPIEMLSRLFEAQNPDVQVKIFYNAGLAIRQTIAAMENIGPFFIGNGPIHIVAPGGDELITRLEQKYYVLPGTRRSYAAVPLVLVVPATLVDAPGSFEELKEKELRVAVADPSLTVLGQQTKAFLSDLGILSAVRSRLDVATDTEGVLDHVLHGNADVGIIFGPDAVRRSESVRIVATAGTGSYQPTIHSMAMERFSPNREITYRFLDFIQSPEAQRAIERLGYESPTMTAKKR